MDAPWTSLALAVASGAYLAAGMGVLPSLGQPRRRWTTVSLIVSALLAAVFALVRMAEINSGADLSSFLPWHNAAAVLLLASLLSVFVIRLPSRWWRALWGLWALVALDVAAATTLSSETWWGTDQLRVEPRMSWLDEPIPTVTTALGGVHLVHALLLGAILLATAASVLWLWHLRRLSPPTMFVLVTGSLGVLLGVVVSAAGAQTNLWLGGEALVMAIIAAATWEHRLTQRLAELRYRSFVDQSTEAFWRIEVSPPMPLSLSLDSQVEWLLEHAFISESNQAHARVAGVEDAADLLGRGLDVLWEGNRTTARTALGRWAALGYRTTRMETHFPDASPPRWFMVSGVPIIRRGRLFSFAGLTSDVTEQREAMARVQRLAAAIEQAAESVAIVDRDGLIEYVNPAFEKVTGYSANEAVGVSPRLLKSGKHDASFYRELWETVTQGQIWRGTIINRRKDGSNFTEEMTISPVSDVNGEISHFVSVRRDITREAELTEQLQQSQRLQAIGTLASGIAHDFNNILSPILGYSELLLDDVPVGSDAHGYVEELLVAGMRAKTLTQQILSYGRKRSGKLEPLDVCALVSEVLSLFKASMPAGVTLVTPPCAGPATVAGDSSQLHQVLMNLATNALHAMNGRGTLTVEIQNSQLPRTETANGPEPYVVVRVTDTGHGMSKQTITRIFDPYFTTKGEGEGTGLGLAMVHTIVEAHGGVIRVQSVIDEGTTFEVWLPNADAQTESDAAPEASESRAGRETVVLVDDEPSVRKILSKILVRKGYTVEAFGDPREAIAAVSDTSRSFDVLVTDRTMPHMTGMELTHAVRAVRTNLPVVLITGSGPNEVASAAEGAVFQGVLHKPIRGRDLVEMIHRILRAQ